MQRIYEGAQKVIEYSFYALLFITPFIFSPWNSELFETPKMYFTYALTFVIVGAWVIKSVTAGKFIFRRTMLDLPLALFLLSQIVSSYFSIDPHTSIWGYYSRLNGGLVSTLCYLLLYWALVSNLTSRHVLRALRLLIVAATIISVWAILERLGVSPSCLILKHEFNSDCWVQKVSERAFASLGQPNWLAAWLVAIIPLSWVNLVLNNTKNRKASGLQFLISAVIFAGLLSTKSRSGLLGLAGACVVFLLGTLWLKRKQLNNLTIKQFLPLIACYLLLIATLGTPWSQSLYSLLTHSLTTHYSQPTPLAEGGTESGEIRKIVWKGAINIWHAYPLFGPGVETFAYSYYNFRPVEHNLTSEWELLYNKAHNEYLNYLATTGTFGFTGYVLIILVFLMWSTKKILNYKLKITNEKEHSEFIICNLAFLSGFVSILVTNFLGFSVVTVATLFFLLPALAIVLTQTPYLTTKPTTHYSLPNLLGISLLLTTLLSTSYMLVTTIRYFRADLLFASSQKSLDKETYAQALKDARDSTRLRDDEPIYWDQLAKVASHLGANLEETGEKEAARELADLARDSSLYATSLSPRNLSLLKSQSLIFYRLTSVDPTFLDESVKPLEAAIILAPTDPKVHYNLGVLYDHQGKLEKARELLEKAIELKSDYYDARTGLGELYTKLGLKDKAREQYEYVLQNINPEDKEVENALKSL